MGFNPFKAVKKVLKSDAGKLALGVGAFMYGPKLFGADMPMGGKDGWGQGSDARPPDQPCGATSPSPCGGRTLRHEPIR